MLMLNRNGFDLRPQFGIATLDELDVARTKRDSKMHRYPVGS
jgi:hypothetical protein